MDKNISVIICSYSLERLNDIYEAISSVQSQTLKPKEIIVAVDHNEELYSRLKSAFQPHQVTIVINRNAYGSSATRNCGILTSHSELIASLDDDAVADVHWLERLIAPFKDPLVMAVGGQVTLSWPKKQPPHWFPEEFDFMLGGTEHKRLILSSNSEIRNVNEGNCAFRREVFESLGLMDEKLGRCDTEDIDFDAIGGEGAEICLRIVKKIPKSLILFQPTAVIYHKIGMRRAKPTYMLRYAFREGVTRAVLRKSVLKYGEGPLAAENMFLRQILFKSIPRRIKKIYRFDNLAQLFMIIANLNLMAFGYLLGWWRYRKHREL